MKPSTTPVSVPACVSLRTTFPTSAAETSGICNGGSSMSAEKGLISILALLLLSTAPQGSASMPSFAVLPLSDRLGVGLAASVAGSARFVGHSVEVGLGAISGDPVGIGLGAGFEAGGGCVAGANLGAGVILGGDFGTGLSADVGLGANATLPDGLDAGLGDGNRLGDGDSLGSEA